MTAKRKLAMSGVAIITVLTLVAGATMAWFTDTEKVNANFSAGVLDITAGEEGVDLDFENLRPMKDEGAFLTEVNAVLDDADYYDGKGYDPAPVYVQEFAISNKGTLPVNLKLKIDDREPAGDDTVPGLKDNGVGGVLNTQREVPCNNELGKVFDGDAFIDKDNDLLKFVLLQKVEVSDGKYDYVKVEDLSIAELKAGYQLLGEDGKVLVLPAGETVESTYALGAYLDSETGNMYQGKEYHITMSVLASQTDEGATFAE